MKQLILYFFILISLTVAAQNDSPTSGTSANMPNVRTFTANGESFQMVEVEGGTFMMGATAEQAEPLMDEKPVHEVTLRSFFIGQTEVTQALWQAVMGSNPSDFTGSKRPVENFNWDDCLKFISKLNALTGKHFRLPTEAEWEYASRGGNKSQGYMYSGSNNLNDIAWFEDNSDDATHNVATKQGNELGIYDMSGNVLELCSDWYGDYQDKAQKNPKGSKKGLYRVVRGGSWLSKASKCRSSYRNSMSPDEGNASIGLRLALSK